MGFLDIQKFSLLVGWMISLLASHFFDQLTGKAVMSPVSCLGELGVMTVGLSLYNCCEFQIPVLSELSGKTVPRHSTFVSCTAALDFCMAATSHSQSVSLFCEHTGQ